MKPFLYPMDFLSFSRKFWLFFHLSITYALSDNLHIFGNIQESKKNGFPAFRLSAKTLASCFFNVLQNSTLLK